MNVTATLVVESDSPIEFSVEQEKWRAFLEASEIVGRSPEKLLSESIDLCMDTAIGLATHMQRETES
jgi:hypothetical protein